MCDCYPCSVVAVINENEVVVIKHGEEVTYTKRKNGKWIEKGSKINDWGYLSLGYAENYQCQEL